MPYQRLLSFLGRIPPTPPPLPSLHSLGAHPGISTSPPGDGQHRRPLAHPEGIYDVFVSYRGSDVKTNFLSHLRDRLKERGIIFFWDDDPENRGQHVNDVIFGSIPNSRITILLLSPNYANSHWCLDELKEIQRCKEEKKLQGHEIILPIFFDVSVGDVKNQKGKFGEGLQRLIKERKVPVETASGWIKSLAKAGKLIGFSSRKYSNEAELIHDILRWLSNRGIPDHYCNLGRGVVGRDQDATNVISLCSNAWQQNKACLVGLYGMQEVGKTSLAKLVLSRIYRDFNCVSFFANVRNENPEGLANMLLLHFFSKGQQGQGPLLFDLQSKIERISLMLRGTKAMLVLDDVDDIDKVKDLLAGRERFHSGSTILLTVRDERLLDELQVVHRYMVSALSPDEALKLFSSHVPGSDEPEVDVNYQQLSADLCHYTGGLPCQIEKLGSHIRDKYKSTRLDLERTLEKLMRIRRITSVGFNPTKDGPFPRNVHSPVSFDDKDYTGVRQIKIITVGTKVKAISVDYDQGGCLVRPGAYGETHQGHISTIKLNYPREFLVSISGHIGEDRVPEFIQSLKLKSNLREYDPYGVAKGRAFNVKVNDNYKIIGFHGKYGASLNSIGAYFETIVDPFPFKEVGPFGGHTGDPWDDGKHSDVRQVDLVFGTVVESVSVRYDDHGRHSQAFVHGNNAGHAIRHISVELDHPYEYLTSISGYITENYRESRIGSITLHSNLRSYGPYGIETGRGFSFPTKCGKIVGFYGRCRDGYLESLGVHYEMVSHIYPFKRMGPFGNITDGDPWDDGKHANIKQIAVSYGSFVNSLTCEYDDADRVVPRGGWGPQSKVIKLDYPDEYITSMCGYFEEEPSPILRSITFQSNRRTWGPYGNEKGTYFSLPLDSGKIVGLFGTTGGNVLKSIGAYTKAYSSEQYPFRSVGVLASEIGETWDDGRNYQVKEIEITVKELVLRSIKFTYATDKGLQCSLPHGNVSGKIIKITLDEDEYLTSLSGYFDANRGFVSSLKFQTNRKTHGYLRNESGKYFSFPATGGKIVGFYGRSSDSYLTTIGAHFEPIPYHYPGKYIGPFGGQGGKDWWDEKSNGVKEVKIISNDTGIVRVYALYEKSGKPVWSSGSALDEISYGKVDMITLEYPNEYLTSISGYVRDYDPGRPVTIRSLIFHSNKRSYGPYGKKDQKGSFFWYPPIGGKIVSFFGRCSPSHLCSIGVYMEPISHQYPFKKIGPFGGLHHGKPWDDGIFSDVREIHMVVGSVIIAFGVEYDNNGCPFQCAEHGNDQSSVDCSDSAQRNPKRRQFLPEAKPKSVSIRLKYPKEYLISISGYTGVKDCEEVVLSLTVKTNLKTYETSGTPRGNYFQLPSEENCGKIVGFHGTSGRFLNSLGARLQPF